MLEVALSSLPHAADILNEWRIMYLHEVQPLTYRERGFRFDVMIEDV